MRIHGRSGAISISANTSPAGSPADGDLVVVGSLRSWSLSFTRDIVESTSLRSAAKTYQATMEDVRGGFDGVFDTDSIDLLLAANRDADAVWIRITPHTGYPELFFQGSAWVNTSMTGSVNDAVKVSGSFTGNGLWQQSLDA